MNQKKNLNLYVEVFIKYFQFFSRSFVLTSIATYYKSTVLFNLFWSIKSTWNVKWLFHFFRFLFDIEIAEPHIIGCAKIVQHSGKITQEHNNKKTKHHKILINPHRRLEIYFTMSEITYLSRLCLCDLNI